MRLLFLSLLFFSISHNALCQTQSPIIGAVVDAAKGYPLPFISVGLKKNMIGTISNEGGMFELILPSEFKEDTLQISGFGYKRMLIPISSIDGPLTIRLQESTIALTEVEVKPLPAEFYVRRVLQSVKQNYPLNPFQAIAYYREKISENKAILQFNEGVFKTYCPNYCDSVRNQDQALLFRKEEHPKELQFMKKEREEAEKKESKNGKKKSAGLELEMTNAFGGPSIVLSATKLNKENASYLDTARLKSYHFKFARPTSFDQSELMVIEFKSKGKVDHVRESGKIFIDRNSLAIVRIESEGDLVIPILLRPLIFVYGLGISNPTYTKTLSFRKAEDRWYPEQVFSDIQFELTKRHLFSKNDESFFEIEQAYVLNQVRTENIKPIPPDHQINQGNIEKSVFNDEKLNWENVNKIKK